MYSSGSISRWTLATAALLGFGAVLFIDFTPAPFGGYADQRFLLLALSGLLVIISSAFLVLNRYSSICKSLRVLVPITLLCGSFFVLSLPFRGQLYVWVEPGMYAFFFFATVVSGAWASWTGSNENVGRDLVLIVVATCSAYGLATINIYLFALFDGETDLVNFIPWGFGNIRYWSHIATWCIPLMPLAILVGRSKQHRIWRTVSVLGAGLWWWILILSTSRGSALGIAFGAVLVLILFGRRALPWLNVFFGGVLVGFVIWGLLSVAIPTLIADDIQIRSIKADSSGRIPLFIEAFSMSLQNFPFGLGPQSWLTHEILTDGYSQSRHFGHPHNMYLMWAAEYGWVLIALLGLVVAQAVRYFWIKRSELFRGNNDEHTFLLIGVTASVSAALFHAGVSAVFVAPGSMIVGLFVLIAFWALIIPTRSSSCGASEPERPSGFRKVFALLIGLALMTLWLLWMNQVWAYFEDMRLDEQTYFEEVGGGIQPRFWFHGNFPRSE
ncbi:hypothetical protein C7H10_12050 [Marinobacter shengliensis]|nr:hypothetical protein C7H10_12050 [Marinobacter shengliensis]